MFRGDSKNSGDEGWFERLGFTELLAMGGFLLTAIGLLIGAFVALPAFWALVLGLGPITIVCLGVWYFLILAAPSSDTGEDVGLSDGQLRRLRMIEALRKGESPGRVYERSIGWVLDKVDAFYGDREKPQVALSNWVGLAKPVPFWTAESYDRSLLIALLYPFAVCLLVWLWTGSQGPAEAAFRLPADSPSETRVLGGSSMLALIAGSILFIRSNSWRQWIGFAILLAASFALVFGFVAGGLLGSAAVVAVAFGGARAVTIFALGSIAAIISMAGEVSIAGVFGAIAVVGFAGITTGIILVKRFSFESFLPVLTIVLIVFSFFAPLVLGALPNWNLGGPNVLFFGVFTLVNAPFDWLTLGVSRLLLRAGLVPGRYILMMPRPLFFGLLDFLFALAIIVALAVITALTLQFYGALELAGGAPQASVPLAPILADLADPVKRYEPTNAWIYFMLFSTLVPSLVNLVCACFAFLRGFAPINQWAWSRMLRGPAGWERLAIAAWLGFQPVAGIALGLILVLYPVQWLFFGLGPSYGEGLLSVVTWIADQNWPASVLDIE